VTVFVTAADCTTPPGHPGLPESLGTCRRRERRCRGLALERIRILGTWMRCSLRRTGCTPPDRRGAGGGRARFHPVVQGKGPDPARDGTDYAGLIADALESLTGSREPHREAGLLHQHDVVELFAYLARAGLPEDRLARLEWSYLGALGYDARPVALARAMATDPDLFAVVVALVYCPRTAKTSDQDGDEAKEETAEKQETAYQRASAAVSANAYRLLSQWKTIPGLREDGLL
jgi:hypothetical protein